MRINENVYLERSVEQVVRLISERLGFYHAAVFLKEGGGAYAILRAASSDGGRRMLSRGHRLEVGGTSMVGHVTATGEYRLARDVEQEPIHFYNPDLPDTRCEMTIPLVVHERVIGALDVQSTELNAFGSEDVDTLRTLAGQLANAIENARLYEELKKTYDDLRQTRRLVGARTALAWVGMTSAAWRHAIDNCAVTIREQAQLLRRDWQKEIQHSRHEKALKRILTIERLATQILDKPITPPLSREEGVDDVPLNAFVSERARQLWQNAPYKGNRLDLELHLEHSVFVRASPEWLRRAFDILVDNAVEAVEGREEQTITIGTRARSGRAEILISDTGPGIPKDVQAKIGLDLIEKPEDAQGLGMGLLMAQAIAETFGGELKVERSGPEGTVMVMWLPVNK